jgi:hypothetical protein
MNKGWVIDSIVIVSGYCGSYVFSPLAVLRFEQSA